MGSDDSRSDMGFLPGTPLYAICVWHCQRDEASVR